MQALPSITNGIAVHRQAGHSNVHHRRYHVTPAGVAGTGSAGGGVQALDGLNGVDFGTFRDFQGQELVADFGHAANQTAADHDFIALGEAGDQLFVLLGALGLRAPQQEWAWAGEMKKSSIAGNSWVRTLNG